MKETITRYFALFLLMLVGTLQATADLTFSQAAGGFPVVGSDQNAVFIVSENDAEVVTTASNCVIRDIQTITGKRLALRNSISSGDLPIIAGTIGQSAILDNLIADEKVDTTGLTEVWEAYALQLVQNPMEGIRQALVIMGGTPRGTAYGLFEISRRIGVSPYVWWADVEPAPMSRIYVHGDRTAVEKPSVRYRGLFINDEDWAMLPWAKRTIDATYNNIGPRTYEKVMEVPTASGRPSTAVRKPFGLWRRTSVWQRLGQLS